MPVTPKMKHGDSQQHLDGPGVGRQGRKDKGCLLATKGYYDLSIQQRRDLKGWDLPLYKKIPVVSSLMYEYLY